MKTKKNAYLLWLFSFFGIFGFQQFYLGKPLKGIAYIFTGGLWFIGAIIDLFTLGSQVDKYNNQQSAPIQRNLKRESDSNIKSSVYSESESSIKTKETTVAAAVTTPLKEKKKEVISTPKKKKETKKTAKVIEEITIGHVEQKGSQIVVYDTKGKQIKNMSTGGGELKGYGTDFFVLKKGNGNATTYDLNCRLIKSIAIADYEITGASGNNFTTKRKNQMRVYDKSGKMISSRNV